MGVKDGSNARMPGSRVKQVDHRAAAHPEDVSHAFLGKKVDYVVGKLQFDTLNPGILDLRVMNALPS